MKSLFLLLCVLFLSTASQSQTVLYVDSSKAASGSGLSWSTAYKTLNEALNVVNAAPSTVRYRVNIARGTYYAAGARSSSNRDSTFLISRGGVIISGGYPNGGGNRSITANPVRLDGNIGAPATDTDNSFHILVVSDRSSTDTVALEGLLVENGNAANVKGLRYRPYGGDTLDAEAGGGLVCSANRLEIDSCVFTANKAKLGGGAVYQRPRNYFSFVVSNSAFSNNTCLPNPTGGGGGLYVADGWPVLRNVLFTGNSSGQGGAVYISRTYRGITQAGFPMFEGCAFINNTATISGGAVHDYNIYFHPAEWNNCSFSGNSTAGDGGAIYAIAAPLPATANNARDFRNCSFSNNAAQKRGGAICYLSYGAEHIMDSCSFSGNRADSAGGGVWFSNKSLSAFGTGAFITNSLFTADSAAKGGGIYVDTGVIETSTCRFTANQADNGAGLYKSSRSACIFRTALFSGNVARFSGAGMFISGADSATLISNCLFSGNKAGAGGGLFDSASSPQIVHCTFAGDTAGSGNGICNKSSSLPSVLNSILWDGVGNSIANTAGSTASVSYSTVQGGLSGIGNDSLNPLFVAPLPSGAAPTIAGDYHLTPCSPPVNAGLNIGSYSGVKDLSGSARLFGNTVDQGAYELQSSSFAILLPPITGKDSVYVGDSLHLSNAVSGGTWSSSDTSIGNADATGVVAAIAAGTVSITYSKTNGVCSASVTKVLTVLPAPTGISANPDRSASLSVYPNPSSGTCSIRIELPEAADYRVELRDLSGRLILQTSGKARESVQLISLPSERLNAGIYLVSLCSPRVSLHPLRWVKSHW